ncbi:MAG: 30S ribosomal protein S8e [Thermoplasmatota archaeon]
MALWQGRSRRKPSGGMYRPFRKKRKSEIGREVQLATIGSTKTKKVRVRSAHIKIRLMQGDHVNLLDPRTKKVQRVKILTVLENPANPHYVQRNIISKGAILKTELGRARVTSRPGQHGVLNAVLIA